jgi:S1-C subfamily serine protease
MIRLFLCGAVLVALTLAVSAETPPRPGLREARAVQDAMRNAIATAEPAIACVLVSRSDAYKQFRPDPSASSPGELGPYDSTQVLAKLLLTDQRRELAKQLDLSNPDNVPEAYGSGIVLDAKRGLILTNFHVVREATKIYVRLPGRKGSYANIHAADGRSDLAILRLLNVPVGLKALSLGKAEALAKGDWLISLANPFAAGFRDGNPSASWGILSNFRQRVSNPTNAVREDQASKTLHHLGTLLQTDARLNLGCSGGALLNLDGDLVGMTTALAAISGGETAGGFGIPFDPPFRRIVEVLLRGEEVEYGFLGVALGPPTHQPRINNVTPGTPAATAGLRPNDAILAINGTPVHSIDDAFFLLGTTLAGQPVQLQVSSHFGQPPRTVTVPLAKFYYSGPIIAANRPAAVRGMRVDYASVQLENMGRLTGLAQGVMVRELVPDSLADKAGLKVGSDIITHLNDQPLKTPADFYRLANAMPGPWKLRVAERPEDVFVPAAK